MLIKTHLSMKPIYTLLCLLFICCMTFAQQKKSYNHSEEIDNQLWKTFVKAYNEKDAEAYLSLHTKDILRITTSGVREGEVFWKSVRESFARKNQPERVIEFKFEHRIHHKEVAYEVGYFKVTYFRNGKEEDYFGRFSVVLRKKNDKWLIAHDWDVDRINGIPITLKDYVKLDSKIISEE